MPTIMATLIALEAIGLLKKIGNATFIVSIICPQGEGFMFCKIFIRTFPPTEEADLFESILQTRWPSLLENFSGVSFGAYRNKQTPHILTVVWDFPDEATQAEIEKLIDEHIKKFTQTLSPKTVTFSGEEIISIKS